MSTPSRKTILLATDQQQSVLNALAANQPRPIAYSPYGHRPAANGLLSLLGFNGEPPDALTGNYHLGNGYRMYSPIMGRFSSPDRLSPFGKGGLNAYAYCGSDPVNRIDPTGTSWKKLLINADFSKIHKFPRTRTNSEPVQTAVSNQWKNTDFLKIPKIPRIRTNSKPVQTTVSSQWEITEKIQYLDKRLNPLTRVINGDGKISLVPTEKLKRAQEQARNQARAQRSLAQTEAWVETHLRHVPTTQGISTQAALIRSEFKPSTT